MAPPDEPDDPSPSDEKALAPAFDEESEPVPEFEFRVSLSPDEVIAAFRDDARVEWHPGGPPGAAPYVGKPFQGWPDGPGTVVVRAAVQILSFGPSPHVHIYCEPLPTGGSLVRGKFLRRARPDAARKWFVWAPLGLLVFVLYAWLLNPVYIVYVLLGVFGLFAARRLASNKPTQKSMFHFGKPLWSLVGEKFVPHALGTGEDNPFRDRALPEGR